MYTSTLPEQGEGRSVPVDLRRYVSARLQRSPPQQGATRPLEGTLSRILTGILASTLAGDSALPSYLGLGRDALNHLLALAYGSAPTLDELMNELIRIPAYQQCAKRFDERGALRALLASQRQDEVSQLVKLLSTELGPEDEAPRLVARIVAHACLGGQHLWKDLGLNSRAELRLLLSACFPQLVAKNTRDMRWKRFFYRQLCELGGDYVCRAPSCDECSSFEECFVVSGSDSIATSPVCQESSL